MAPPSKPHTSSFYRRWALILSAVNSNLEGLNIASLSLTPLFSPMTSYLSLLTHLYSKMSLVLPLQHDYWSVIPLQPLKTHFPAHRSHSLTGNPCQGRVLAKSEHTEALDPHHCWAALSTTDPHTCSSGHFSPHCNCLIWVNTKIILHLPGPIKVKQDIPCCFLNPSHSS